MLKEYSVVPPLNARAEPRIDRNFRGGVFLLMVVKSKSKLK